MIEITNVRGCGNCTEACFDDCINSTSDNSLKNAAKVLDEGFRNIGESINKAFENAMNEPLKTSCENCEDCNCYENFKPRSKRNDISNNDKIKRKCTSCKYCDVELYSEPCLSCHGYNNKFEYADVLKRDDILDQAKAIINGERQGTYGNAEDSFQAIADLWASYLCNAKRKSINIESEDVANMMILMKVARNSSGVYKEDNWIDICGYAALGGEIGSRA